MHRFFHRTTALCTSLIAVGLLAACASTTPSPALEEARTAVSTAAGDPAVNQYAQLELKQATDALAKADRVWADDRDTSETNHLAYIARQRAEIATNAARARQPNPNTQQGGSEADRIRLQARTQEADAARLRAQQAQQQAMSAEQRAAQQQAQATAAMAKANSAQAGPRLDKLANFLKQFPDRKLLIEGYTDSVGSDSYNQDLSDRRAQAVRDALVQRGVDTSRITARGYGKAHPVADNASPEGRAMNRRVEIVIADDKGNLRGR